MLIYIKLSLILFDTVQRIPPPFPLYSHDKLPALP